MTVRLGKIPCALRLTDCQWPSGTIVPTYHCACGVRYDSIIRMSRAQARVAHRAHINGLKEKENP